MQSDQTVVGIARSGNPDAVIHRRGNDVRQATSARTGMIWLCPRGAAEDQTRITGCIEQTLHITLPHTPFRRCCRSTHTAAWTAHRSPTAMPDPLLLSQLQWAWVIGWHILLPAFTVGLASFIAVLEDLYFFRRDEGWLRISLFWTSIFSVSFAMAWSRGSADMARSPTPSPDRSDKQPSKTQTFSCRLQHCHEGTGRNSVVRRR